MLLVDVTIVQVALPTIQRRLHAGFSDLEWVIDAYALSLASVILTCGALADRYGRKRVFLAGVAVFTLASLGCGAATGPQLLIAGRAIQGLGGAAMFATGLALIGQDFHGPERGRAIAAWGATVGAAVAVGPLIGGALTDTLGWRSIFFVNVPVGLVTVAIALRMRNIGDPAARRLDAAGLVTFAGSLFLLVLGLLRGTADGWTSSTIVALLAGSAVVMAAFVAVELRQERPMFDLSLFRNPGFVGVSLATFAIGAGMFALYPYLTLYLQNDLGYSPLGGGLRLLPSTVLCFVVPLASRRAVDRIPPGAALAAGLAITAAGVAAMLDVGPGSDWTALIPGLLLTGIGIGIANPAIARVGLGVVEPQRSGMASGISNTCRIGGLATGVAALGAIFQSRLQSSLSTHASLPLPASALARALASGGLPAVRQIAPGNAALVPVAHHAFVSGMTALFVVGTGVVLAGGIAAAALVRRHHMHPAMARPQPAPERI